MRSFTDVIQIAYTLRKCDDEAAIDLYQNIELII